MSHSFDRRIQVTGIAVTRGSRLFHPISWVSRWIFIEPWGQEWSWKLCSPTSLFYRWENQDPERLNASPKVTQLDYKKPGLLTLTAGPFPSWCFILVSCSHIYPAQSVFLQSCNSGVVPFTKSTLSSPPLSASSSQGAIIRLLFAKTPWSERQG